jgi:hypothetical protein
MFKQRRFDKQLSHTFVIGNIFKFRNQLRCRKFLLKQQCFNKHLYSTFVVFRSHNHVRWGRWQNRCRQSMECITPVNLSNRWCLLLHCSFINILILTILGFNTRVYRPRCLICTLGGIKITNILFIICITRLITHFSSSALLQPTFSPSYR